MISRLTTLTASDALDHLQGGTAQVLTSVVQHVCNTAAAATAGLQRPEEEALQGAAAELAAATALLQAIIVPQ